MQQNNQCKFTRKNRCKYQTLLLHLVHKGYLAVEQAGTTCGASSQPDLIQNHFLIARMLRFLRRKVAYFNIL